MLGLAGALRQNLGPVGRRHAALGAFFFDSILIRPRESISYRSEASRPMVTSSVRPAISSRSNDC